MKILKHLFKFNNKDTRTISDEILLSSFEPSPYKNDIWKHQPVVLSPIGKFYKVPTFYNLNHVTQRGINAAPIKGAMKL